MTERFAVEADIETGAERKETPTLVTVTSCLGEYCPRQTNSIGETEGVDAIRATVGACSRVFGCILEQNRPIPAYADNDVADMSDEQRDNSGGNTTGTVTVTDADRAENEQYDTDMSDEQWSNS